MKSIKSLDYLLGFGMFMLFFAGMSLMGNAVFEYALVRCSGMALITFIFYILSILFKKLLNVDISSKVAYGLGCLSLVITFITSGGNNLFGTWFSLNGGGTLIFLASIALLIGILATLTAILYKNYNFIHLAFISVIFVAYFLLSFYKINYQIIFIIISLILLVLNIIKINKSLYTFSSVAIYICALISLIAMFGDSYIFSLVLFLINTFSILRVLSTKKNLENELLSILTLTLLVASFISVTSSNFSDSISLILAVSVVCVIDLVITTFRMLTEKFVKIMYKVFNVIALFIIVSVFDFNNVSHLIALSFILLTSVISTFAIHNDDYEGYILPFKVMFVTYYLNNAFSMKIGAAVYALQAIVFALVSRKFNESKLKPLYIIMTIISLFLMMLYIDKSLIINSISVVAILITYLIVRGKEDSVSSNFVFVFSLIFMIALTEYIGFVEELLLIMVSGVLAYIHRNNKVCFSASMILLMVMIGEFLEETIVNYSLYNILYSLMGFILIGIASEVLFTNIKHKNIFAGIMFTLGFLDIEFGEDFLISIYALIASLSLMLVSIKNSGYKSLYYIGLVFGAINLLGLLFMLDGIPASLYLLIIALVLIIVVSIMIYRFQNRKVDEVSGIKPVIAKKEVIKYCSHCGNKVGKDDTFCGECGKKIE